MNRLRNNARVVALVVYALLVNLAWFAAISAHHADLSEAWCSQTSAAPESNSPLRHGDQHEACHNFCVAHGAGVATPAIAAAAGAFVATPQPLSRPAAVISGAVAPWQARGPPLA